MEMRNNDSAPFPVSMFRGLVEVEEEVLVSCADDVPFLRHGEVMCVLNDRTESKVLMMASLTEVAGALVMDRSTETLTTVKLETNPAARVRFLDRSFPLPS
jgi:hypothetical protein